MEPDKEPAEHNAVNLTKFVATGDAFVKSSVVQTQRSCVQDNVLIQGGGNAAGMLPANTSVQITRRVAPMGLVVTLDRRAAKKVVYGLVFRTVIRTVISSAARALLVILAVLLPGEHPGVVACLLRNVILFSDADRYKDYALVECAWVSPKGCRNTPVS